MIKAIKKVFLSAISILSLSVLCWTIAFLNPSLMYANRTTIDIVTIHHNDRLVEETENIIMDALEIIKTSDLYSDDIKIDLCLNEGSYYPQLHPFKGGIAYSFLNKSIIYDSQPDFSKNITVYTNNNEVRKANLTWLLAHEFTHNLQFHMDKSFIFKYDFWQQEGYAEYISREWKNDGRLKEKIQYLIAEEQKEHNGLPVFLLPDGTIQILSYYKYGLMVQYLVEQENLNFPAIEKEKRTLEQVYADMISWSER